MERFIESIFGLKFWRNNPKKQKAIEKKRVKSNLARISNCISGSCYNPQFGGNRNFIPSHMVTGK